MKALLLIVITCMANHSIAQSEAAADNSTNTKQLSHPKYYALPNKFNKNKRFYIAPKAVIEQPPMQLEKNFINSRSIDFPLRYQGKNYSLPYTTQLAEPHPVSLPTPAQLVVKPTPVWQQVLGMGLGIYVDEKRAQNLRH